MNVRQDDLDVYMGVKKEKKEKDLTRGAKLYKVR